MSFIDYQHTEKRTVLINTKSRHLPLATFTLATLTLQINGKKRNVF